jgi:hypothetical protein
MEKFKQKLSKREAEPDVNMEKLHTVLYDIIMSSESEEFEMIKQNVSNKEELIQFIQKNCIVDHGGPEEAFQLPLSFLESNKVFFDNDCKIQMPSEMHALLMELFANNGAEEEEPTFDQTFDNTHDMIENLPND